MFFFVIGALFKQDLIALLEQYPDLANSMLQYRDGKLWVNLRTLQLAIDYIAYLKTSGSA